MKKTFAILSILLTPQLASASFISPKNFDECILQSMKGVSSDVAARAVRKACQNQFSETLSNEQGQKLKGYGDLWKDTLRGEFYNGNDSITVTELTLVVKIEKKSGDVTKRFKVQVNISPLSTGRYSITVPEKKESDGFSFWVESAKGY